MSWELIFIPKISGVNPDNPVAIYHYTVFKRKFLKIMLTIFSHIFSQKYAKGWMEDGKQTCP